MRQQGSTTRLRRDAPARPASACRRSTTRLRRGALLIGLALAPTPALADTGPLAAYLRARVADARGSSERASADYAAALAASPDPVVAIRAYREALAAGDLALADRAVAVLTEAGAAPEDAVLLRLARAARSKDRAAFDGALAALDRSKLSLLAPSLRAWAAWSRRRDWSAPLAAPEDPVARRLAAETRALIQIAAGREREGAAALRAMAGPSDGDIVRLAAAELLVRERERELARQLLPDDDPALAGRVLAGRGAKPSLAFGTARTLTRLAADLVRGEGASLSVTLLRAALVADPGDDMARLLLAASLNGSGASAAALAALDAIPADRPLARDAAVSRVQVLAQAGRRDEALALAESLAARPDAGRNEWQGYADLLVAADRVAEAVPLYARIVAGDGADDWAAWMQYGGALEQAGRWDEARAALAKAVEIAPEEPLALNYLGYARLVRGEQPAESTRLLERAHKLAPEDPSIADSLGWAYHLTGDTRRALPLLERAAQEEPGSAEIGEHLGDAYWSLGRRFEARYAWTAAALVANPKERERIERKLARGLDG